MGLLLALLYVFAVCLQIVAMNCDLKSIEGGKMEVFLKVNFEDKMQRELYSELKEGELEVSL